MNDNNVTDPIQPQESSQEKIQPTGDISNGIGQKGNSLIILGVIFLVIIVGVGAYILGTKKTSTSFQPQTNPSSSTNNTQTKPNTISQPSTNESWSVNFAFIRDYNVWVNINGKEKQLTKDTEHSQSGIYTYPKLSYSNPSISPDGTKIAFFKTLSPQGQSTTNFYVISIDGSKTIVRSTNDTANIGYPPQWSSDSETVFYEAQIQVSSPSEQNTKVISIDTVTGEQKELTRYTVQSGCGGGSSDPSFGLAGLEGARPVYARNFHLSSNNNYLMHNTACTGYGIAVYNLQTQQDKQLADNITQAIFSPDGAKIAGISRNSQILLFDTKTGGSIKTLTLAEQPQVLYWSQDGQTIYYGTDKLIKILSAKDDLGNTLEGKQNQASLWSIPVDGSSSKRLYDFDAYDIKPLAVSSEKSKIMLIKVDNPDNYFNALNQNNKNLSNLAPAVNVVVLNLVKNSTTNISQKATQSSVE